MAGAAEEVTMREDTSSSLAELAGLRVLSDDGL
jgi:hypothetical protein